MQQPMIDSYNVRKKEKKENGMWFWERADDLRGEDLVWEEPM